MGTPANSVESPRPATFVTIAAVLVIIAVGWYLLRELSPMLRPLLVAVILGYVLMPYHSRLSKQVTAPVSIMLLAGFTAAVLVLLALAVYLSILGLNEELPRLERQIAGSIEGGRSFLERNAPSVLENVNGAHGEELAGLAAQAIRPILNGAASALVEAGVVGLYLVFLLLEAARFPDRVRAAYSPQRADEILHLAGQVNAAVVSYLKAKVCSSLILALPVGIVLATLGVKFAFLWAVLTFLCNFVPYIGSVLAFCFPVAFAFVQFGFGWQPVTAAVLVLGCQAASAAFVEPMLLGKAVGLSPLVILGSLAFWGLLWGIPGMILAIPLTVMAVIVMNHFDSTRPVARLLSSSGT